ncbi:hypothetical protein C0J52_21549 [Blattella germanica]|nr:hypothetical protein C0J52_21549 [Blattella germanica]
MSESSDNKPDESFLSEVSIEDGENTEPVDWKLNNTNLAKENALLRKEIQRYANIFKENSIRCNNLEVAWRRRGETLAKVDIISRLAGTQILKLLDSLTELRTACQVDLQTPLEGATGIPTNVKPQLVNHVNPMVSGHPIIKPTITLRRLNINTSTRPQEEEILEPVEEVVLSGSENQSSESEDEEDDIVIPPNFRSEMHSEIDFVHSDNEVIEIDSTPANISSTSDSSLPTTANSASTSDSLLPTTANSASTSGSSLPANSMRKYPGSSSKLSEDRKSDILAGVEKCRLVVSLRDVGSYLHNGILSSIEQRNQSANRSSRQKKQIPASLKSSSKLSKGNHDEAQCEDDDGTNLTNCVALSVKTDVSPTDCKYEEQTNYSASSNEGPPVLEVQENFSITKNNKKRKGKSSGVKVKVERCNPNRKPPSLKKETNAATPQANRKPPSLKNETIEVAPVFDSKIKDKTESSTSSDEFLGFPTSNVSDENANMTRKRRKLLSLGSDADEEENEDEDYIPPSQRSKNSKRGTTTRKQKGKSINSSISKKKKKADNTNVVQGYVFTLLGH